MSTQTIVVQGIESTFRLALELIRTYTILALLFLERFQDIGNRFNPGLIEDTGITGFFPILIGQTKRVA